MTQIEQWADTVLPPYDGATAIYNVDHGHSVVVWDGAGFVALARQDPRYVEDGCPPFHRQFVDAPGHPYPGCILGSSEGGAGLTIHRPSGAFVSGPWW